MARPKVFVTCHIAQEAVEWLRRDTDVTLWPDDFPPPPEALLREVANVQGILCDVSDLIDRQVLDEATELRVVSNLATGTDNIDVAEATRRGIPVGHTPGVLTETCADLAFALLMAAARRIVEADRWVRQGRWRTSWLPDLFLGADIHGATLGIVGMGSIGLAIARRAQGFGMDILYYSRTRRRDDEEQLKLSYTPELETLLHQSDFVSLHVPLTQETYHLIGERELAQMKPSAILVNTARGRVVDQAALERALRDGVIAAAALDVTEEEPIRPDDPLLSLDNCIITPHIGSASVATRTRMALLAADNLLAGLKGKPLPHSVNQG